MSTGPRVIGTLIVVVLKARNLPNKRHIGKQDPYCLVTLNGEKRRTKAIKRGGQHPEWDEEIRFTVYEENSTENTGPVGPNGTPPPPPPKKANGPPKIQGGILMAVACYAEDLREPDFIGETRVDLTEVLTKGETDEWFTLMNKDKYCGEVYLELTFWSNEPVPAKKNVSKPKNKKQYGGPGSFVPSDGPANSSFENVNDSSLSSRLSSANSLYDVARREAVPPSLRPSSSLAKIDLYQAPYETNRSHNSVSSVDSLANDFGQLTVKQDNLSRRTSLPPMPSGFQPRQSSISSSTSGYLDPQAQQYSYDAYGSYSPNDGNAYGYDRPVTPNGGYQPYPPSQQYQQNAPPAQPATYHPPYETPARPASAYPGGPRHPRHSLPTASSGFMPIPTPAPSGFVPVNQHNTGYYGQVAPPVSATPAPQSSHFPPPGQLPPTPPTQPNVYGAAPPVGPSPTPAPSNLQYGAPMGYPPSTSYHAISPSQSYPYQYPPPPGPPDQAQYPQPPTTVSAPPTMNGTGQHHPLPPPPPPPSVPPQHTQSAPPAPPPEQRPAYPEQTYSAIPPPPPIAQSGISPGSSHGGSRPLPIPNANQMRRRHSVIGMQQQGMVTSPTGGPQSVGYNPYSHVPPPPPLPSSSSMSAVQSQPRPPSAHPTNGSTLPYPPNHQQLPAVPGPPPLPPPRAPSRALSQPPQQQPMYTGAPSRQPSLGHTSPAYPPAQAQNPPPPPPQQQQQHPAMYQQVPPPPPLGYGGHTSHTMAIATSSFHSSPTQPQYPGPLPVPPQVPQSQSHGYPVASGSWQ